MALSLLSAYGSSSEDDSEDNSNVQPPPVAVKVSPRPQAIANAVPRQQPQTATTTTTNNTNTANVPPPAVAKPATAVEKPIKKSKKASASARRLPMLRALPTFEDLEDEEEDDAWLATTTATATQDSKTTTAAKKRKVGDSKHMTLLSKLPAPKHTLHAPPEKQPQHIPMRTPAPAPSHSVTVNGDDDDESEDDDDDEQEPASLRLIESLIGVVPMDTADNNNKNKNNKNNNKTSATAIASNSTTTANEEEEEEDEDAGMVGPMRPGAQQAQYSSYAYDDADDMPAPYIPEDQRNNNNNNNGSSSYSVSASTSSSSSSSMSWNERIAAKKLVRNAEAQLYNLNSGVNGNSRNSTATGEALAALGAQGGTVVSLSDNDFKQDAQRYRDSLPQDDKGEEGPTLQMKRWNTQTGEVTSSTRVGMTSNRKNQISALASQSQGREKELQEQWGKVKTGNADNRKKYGF